MFAEIMRSILYPFVIILSLAFHVSAQSQYQLHIQKAKGKIIIDGNIDEADWQAAEIATNFHQSFPVDTGISKSITECRVTYDDKFFYVSAVCHDLLLGDYVIQSLKRDYSFPISDAFAVEFDPFRDRTNGFNFGVNPMNVQREGLIANGGKFGTSTDWDNKWFSETKIFDQEWVVEIAIPFKSIRFKEGEKTWLINFVRNDLKRNELSTWFPVPKEYNPNTLAFTGELIWDEAPRKTGMNLSVIPYLIGSGYKIDNYKTDAEGNKVDTIYGKANAGLDAKLAITSSLNLDITINPDFSQVEVDRQQTNLTRFSLFYPERRNFFIENSDLFAQFGFSQIRPFFSRNIGLKNGNTVPIIAGLRLSGKLNQNWRLGAMSIQTDKVKSLSADAQNYSVVAVQRRIFSRSNITGIFINRQRFDRKEGFTQNDYNRVAGLQYNISSSNNKWTGIIFYQQSFNPGQPANSYSHASYINYETDKWVINWNHEYVGENFIADIGYVPHLYNYDAATNTNVRRTFWRLEPSISYFIFPKSKKIRRFGFGLYSSDYFDDNFNYTEQTYSLDFDLNFFSTANFSISHEYNNYNLQFDSYIGAAEDALTLGIYKFSSTTLYFKSNTRKKFNFEAGTTLGSFYNGNKYSGNLTLNLRRQPWGVFSLVGSYDNVNFPEIKNDFELYLIGPKIELSFSKSLFLTTFFQYNTQIDNFNINARFQWRFKPMSDLFIVYTDNYNTIGFLPKNKALVLKLNYWFTL